MSWFRKKPSRPRREERSPVAPVSVAPRSARPRAEPRPDPLPEAPVEPQAPAAASAAEMRQAEFALAEGIVTSDVLRGEIARANADSSPLARALLGLHYPSLAEIAKVLGKVAIPRIDLEKLQPSPDAIRRLPAEIARARDCLPLDVFGNVICVAMARPEDLSGIREIRDVTGLRVKALRADGPVVRSLVERHYPRDERSGFRLRPLPVSEETFERARGRNRMANDLAAEWERIWLRGEALVAEPAAEEVEGA